MHYMIKHLVTFKCFWIGIIQIDRITLPQLHHLLQDDIAIAEGFLIHNFSYMEFTAKWLKMWHQSGHF